MTILVTGASGTVGRQLAALADTFPEPFDLAARTDLDITDLAAVQARLRADVSWVINLAAATNLDCAEQDPVWAYRLNTVGAENLALAAGDRGARLLQVSRSGSSAVMGARGRSPSSTSHRR